MTDNKFTLMELTRPLDDWTASRFIVRSRDCPGGVAAIIGGAEEYAHLIAASLDLLRIVQKLVALAKDDEDPDSKVSYELWFELEDEAREVLRKVEEK